MSFSGPLPSSIRAYQVDIRFDADRKAVVQIVADADVDVIQCFPNVLPLAVQASALLRDLFGGTGVRSPHHPVPDAPERHEGAVRRVVCDHDVVIGGGECGPDLQGVVFRHQAFDGRDDPVQHVPSGADGRRDGHVVHGEGVQGPDDPFGLLGASACPRALQRFAYALAYRVSASDVRIGVTDGEDVEVEVPGVSVGSLFQPLEDLLAIHPRSLG